MLDAPAPRSGGLRSPAIIDVDHSQSIVLDGSLRGDSLYKWASLGTNNGGALLACTLTGDVAVLDLSAQSASSLARTRRSPARGGERLLTVGYDGRGCARDVYTAALLMDSEGPDAHVLCAVFESRDVVLVWGAREGERVLHRYDVRDGTAREVKIESLRVISQAMAMATHCSTQPVATRPIHSISRPTGRGRCCAFMTSPSSWISAEAFDGDSTTHRGAAAGSSGWTPLAWSSLGEMFGSWPSRATRAGEVSVLDPSDGVAPARNSVGEHVTELHSYEPDRVAVIDTRGRLSVLQLV
ncbi:MAG: hypothetical protein Q8Q09_25260 [Deltaproteobacteria bacterium]|nr:hypothetical protein [Deltaproteobacteria bacterium]